MKEFLNAIRAAGWEPPDSIRLGEFERYPGLNKPRANEDGWCKLIIDGVGVYGDWSTGEKHHWFSDMKNLSDDDRKLYQAKANQAMRDAEFRCELERQEAAQTARDQWNKAQPCDNHPYLTNKGVKSYGLRISGDQLVVPVRDGHEIISLQKIEPQPKDGKYLKRFYKGGRTKGGYYLIGEPRDLIYVCEGYATAASVHEATGMGVVVAFNAGNLRPVCELLSDRYPNIKIWVAGDNDESGTGQEKAQEAATSVNGQVAIPPERGDWNDYAQKHGADDLRDQLTVTIAPGAAILEEIKNFLKRFVCYPDEHCLIAHALWIAHAHLVDAFESTPRLAFLSPEPASGKTRAIEITELLVPNPVMAVNVTPAYLFRKVGDDDAKPTILYDEIDTVFGPKANGNEEIRGLLNAGHRKGATAGRCVTIGNTVTTEEIPAYSAVAMAGLGNLPDTILSRSVVIRMKPRRSHEKVEPFRRRIHRIDGERLRDRLSSWCESIKVEVSKSYPEMPPGVEDRNADVWEPLIAIADEAGGEWPEIARNASVALVKGFKDDNPSLGVKLLGDLREVLGGAESMPTDEILKALIRLEESPWGNIKGNQLDSRGLAKLLKQYEIKSTSIRTSGHRVLKGYKATDFHDAWSRYLPSLSDPEEAVHPLHPIHTAHEG